MNEPSRPGRVVTFYSYTAGAGRSMAVANVAALLRKWGHSVLLIDWDLDAPGLEHYLEPEPRDGRTPLAHARKRHPGVLDILDGFARERPVSWRECLLWAPVFPRSGPVAILGAGRDDGAYAQKLRGLDWSRLLGERQVASYLQGLRDEWTRDFDYVLIDSRGGNADIGGLCTQRLADVLVLLISANEQCLQGALEVIEAGSVRSALHGKAPRIVPVLARDESASEHDRAVDWRQRVAAGVSDACRKWLPARVAVTELLEQLKLPNKPYWSFGRRLPVVLEGTADPSSLGHAYQVLARLLERDLGWEDGGDVEQRAQSAELELQRSRAALALATSRLRHLAARAGAVLMACMVLALVVRQGVTGAAQRERTDALIAAAHADDDPLQASLLWREVARQDPDRPLGDALGRAGALAWPVGLAQVDAPISALALAHDARTFAFATRDGVFVRELGDDVQMLRLPGFRARYGELRFSRDGTQLLALQAEAAPALWDLATHTAADIPALPAQTTFRARGAGLLGVAADLTSASVWAPGEPNATSLPIAPFGAMQHPSLSLLGPDGAFLGQASVGEREVLLTGKVAGDPLSAAIAGSVDVDCAVQSAAIADSVLAYQCALRDDLVLRPLRPGSERTIIAPPSPQAGPITSLRFSANGASVIALYTNGEANVCQVKSPRCARLREHDAIARAELSPDGGWAITATARGRVRVWRLGLGAQAPRDWGALMATLRTDVPACMSIHQRVLWLAEEPQQAQAARLHCDRELGGIVEAMANGSSGTHTARLGVVGAGLALPERGADSAEPPSEPPGLVRVPIGLVVDSEAGHMLFPLALTGVGAPSTSEVYRVVAGDAEVVEFGGAGSFLQQAPNTTSVVASSRSQSVASRTSLASMRKAPLPWLVVEAKRTREASDWQTMRPYVQCLQSFHWDAARGTHVAQFELGLQPDGGKTAALTQPVALRFSSACDVAPEEISLRELGPAGSQRVTVSCSRRVKNAEHAPWFGIRARGGAIDYALSIPHRPGPFELFTSAPSVLGFGLGALQVTVVHMEEDRSPSPAPMDLPVVLKVEGGRLDPHELIIPAGEPSVTEVVRVGGVRALRISAAAAGRESNSLPVRLTSPLLFLAVTMLGGAAGGFLCARRLRAPRWARPWLWQHAGLRAASGALLGSAIVAGWLRLFRAPVALHESELAWLLGALLAGAVGTTLLVALVALGDRLRAARARARAIAQGSELQA